MALAGMGTVIALPDEDSGEPVVPVEAPAERSLRPRPSYGETDSGDRLMTGKRSVKGGDELDEAAGPVKRQRMSVDTMDVTDVAGNVFLRVQASRRSCLLTFDGHISRPVYFEETDGGPMEVSGPSIGLSQDPMTLKVHGAEVEVAAGERRVATVQELISFLKWVFTNGADDTLPSSDVSKSATPLPCYLHIKCDEASGWLTFDTDTLKPKVVATKGSKVVEVSPQQFELESGCHARKWRNSFKVQSTYKVIRQGTLTPAPYVELSHYLHRMLLLDPNELKPQPSSRVTRELSNGSVPPQQQQSNQQQQQSYATTKTVPGLPRAPSPAAAGRGGSAAAAAAGAERGSAWPSLHLGSASAPSNGNADAAAAAGGGGGGYVGAHKTSRHSSMDGGAAGVRNLGSSFVAIPIAQGGKVAGPLSPAEMQAIQAVVRFTEGPQLAWAVQGIMHHIWSQYRDQRTPPSTNGGKANLNLNN